MTEFEALVRTHQGAVCATAYAVLRDRARSEEVAQDAFLIAWLKLPELSPPPAMPGWICGIARNLARNAARKHRELGMSASCEPIAAMTPLDDALEREDRDVANRALATLTEGDRELVVLYYRGEESIAGVASVLGTTETTARQRLHRSRERLRSAVMAVEASLRATRPGPAFSVACVAALANGVLPANADAAELGVDGGGSLAAPVAGKVWLVLVAVAAAIAVGVLVVRRAATSETTRGATSGGSASVIARSAHDAAPARRSGFRSGELIGHIRASERAAIIDRVSQVLDRAAPPAAEDIKVYDYADTALADVAVPDPPPTGPLSKTTLRYAIKLLQPLLVECRSVGAPGRLAIRMRLVGDAESVTVVESVDITGDSPLSDDAALVECVRETLMALELPPMTEAARWDVTYPLVADAP